MSESDEAKLRMAAAAGLEEAHVVQLELYRIIGQYTTLAAEAEAILDLFLAVYFLRDRDEPEQQRLLDHWYGWLLGAVGTEYKFDLVKRLCEDGLDMEAHRAEGFPELVSQAKGVNDRRNQVAHRSISRLPRIGEDGEVAIDVRTHRRRRKGVITEPVDLVALQRQLDVDREIVAKLNAAHLRVHTVDG